MKREAIGKGLRFQIFDRDGFTCQYCGKCPPEVQLVIDHIIPVSGGGTSEPENLRTSCFACNSGKSNKALGVVANDTDSRRRAQEALEVVDTARKFAQAAKARIKLRNQICTFACDCLGKKECRKTTVTSIIRAMDFYDIQTVMKWVESAVDKTAHYGTPSEDNAMMYFHGIMRRTREQAALK